MRLLKDLTIGIAGAGLLGRTLAWRLARAGSRVILLDARQRDDQNSAAMVAAAMLSPMAELAVSDTEIFALGQRSLMLWPEWIAALASDLAAHMAPSQTPPAPVYFRQEGTLVVAHAPDQGSLTHFTRLLEHKLPADQRAHMVTLDGAQLARLEPALAGRFHQGLHLRTEGQLSNADWMAQLAQVLDALSVDWQEGVAVDRIAGQRLHAGDRQWDVDIAIDARGVGAKPALPALRGVRGEVLRVHCPAVTLQRPVRLMHPRYQLYVAPRPNHEFVVGATELESEDTGPMTLRSALELGSALYSLHPAFGEARVQRLSAALRPALDDDRPVCAQRAGVWHLNGLYRHGYLCAPAAVEKLLAAMAGDSA
jgi:glycine oxidase